jgi:hypothetical protein
MGRMMRGSNDTEPEPPGGRAAERLREFLAQRFPRRLRPEESPREQAQDADRDTEQGAGDDATDREGRRT